MTPDFQTGLVVGKFSPLHAGHEYLIGHALSRCQRVFILSYSNPELPGMETARRQRWLALRFPAAICLALDADKLRELARAKGLTHPPALPTNDASDFEQRDFVLWLCLNVFNCAVDAVFTSESYGDGFAAHLENGFSRARSAPQAVAHVCLDLERSAFPVSGTALRLNPHQSRQWVAPCVNGDLVRRVCLLGGESTGKSTLAPALAAALQTTHVAEYGRELWELKSGHLDYADMLLIAEEQVTREQAAAWDAQQWLVCDTSPLTTLLYCLDMFGKAPQPLWALAARPYDVTLLCVPDFAFVQDGTRRDVDFRQRQHDWYVRALAERGISFTLLQGGAPERLARALQALQSSADADV
jgi:NadR type nicotinamide-nucleotide adenylyltransferase